MNRRSIFAMIVQMAALAAFTAIAAAQDVTVAPPTMYSPSGGLPVSSSQINDPAAILDQDGSVVSVPIPGGGSVQVEGPASEPPAFIPPTENWATQRNNPFSVGTSPLSPVPVPR